MQKSLYLDAEGYSVAESGPIIPLFILKMPIPKGEKTW